MGGTIIMNTTIGKGITITGSIQAAEPVTILKTEAAGAQVSRAIDLSSARFKGYPGGAQDHEVWLGWGRS